MTKQPEALRLADVLTEEGESWWEEAAATELRRLHAANLDVLLHFNALKADYDKLRASNAELLAALQQMTAAYSRLKPPGYPLADCEKIASAAIANATKGKQNDH